MFIIDWVFDKMGYQQKDRLVLCFSTDNPLPAKKSPVKKKTAAKKTVRKNVQKTVRKKA